MGSKSLFSRRDFLKLALLAPAAWYLRPTIKSGRSMLPFGSDKVNIIFLVFDAWSAKDLQVYGHVRNTVPNVEHFAENATVFHNHYTAGTFTVPGTASLLTGLLPWSHRAFQLGAGGVIKSRVNDQIFAALSNTHHTTAFAQNRFADLLIAQAEKYVKSHVPSSLFDLEHRASADVPLFRKDANVAYSSFEDNIVQSGDGYDSSLFLGPLYQLWSMGKELRQTRDLGANYPTGLPESVDEVFRLEDLVDGGIQILSQLQEPSFAYLHFYPPHGLYHPTAQFVNAFDDGWNPVPKPVHPIAYEKNDNNFLSGARRLYDQYMASWDAEVSRLFDYLQSSGLMDRSYVILTSDHGELFERGDVGHWTRMIYEPIVHVPLMIWAPGQAQRQDIDAPTSSIDLLPTIAHLTGNPIPAWAEGQVLPGLGGVGDPNRSIYTVDAKNNPSWAPLTRMTISLTKNGHRLTYYNYPNEWQGYEFYDLQGDPEEMNNLFGAQPQLAGQMQDEMMQKLAEVNAGYRSTGE